MTPPPLRRHALAMAAMAALASFAAGAALALDANRTEVRDFIDALVAEDGFERQAVESVLRTVESKPSILEAMSRPAERVKPWHQYRAIFLTPARIDGGIDFMRQHESRLRRVAAQTGVPAEYITAIIGVETFYGTRTGNFRAIDALSTLAFDYPPRSSFFRKELRQLFLLSREEDIDITSIKGSYAGALGPPQFIPSSYRAYAVDGNGDGRRDLRGDWDDIVASVAHYFAEHRWQASQPVVAPAHLRSAAARPEGTNELTLRDTIGSLQRQGVQFSTDLPDSAPAIFLSLEGTAGDEYWVGFHNFHVITRYNRSVMYALAVHQLAEAIAAGTTRP